MNESQIPNSETAAMMFAGFSLPNDYGERFVKNSALSESIENHIPSAGERKVFGYLKTLTRGNSAGWAGAVSAPELSFHFSNTRRKTSAQHYSRILARLKEKKMIFTVWVNINRCTNIHFNLVWVCMDPSQWDCIFSGCPIYPITVARFIKTLEEIIGFAWEELRRLGLNHKPKTQLNDMIRNGLAKTVATQFIPRMHQDIQRDMPVYNSSISPKEYMAMVTTHILKFDAYYGIDDAKFMGSEKLKKSMEDFRIRNAQKDFENHIFGQENEKFSVGLNSPLETISEPVETVSVGLNSPLEKSSVGLNSPLETENSTFVNDCKPIDSVKPSYAHVQDGDRNKKENNKNKKEERGVTDSKKKNHRVDLENGIDREGENKMDFTEDIMIPPAFGGFSKPQKTEVKKKTSSKNAFDLAAPRNFDIKTKSGVFQTLKDAMQKKHPGFRFCGSWETNVHSRELAETMETIRENGYLDAEILNEWISWYANIYMNHERIEKKNARFISTFLDTWKAFSKTVPRPEEREARRREILSHKVSIANPSKITETENQLINISKEAKNETDAIKSMLVEFGVVVVANWFLKEKLAEDIENSIRKILDSMGLMKLRHVYGQTTMRESSRIKSNSFPFSDWRNRFQASFVDAIGHEIEPVDYECEETDRFLTGLQRK